MSPDDPLPAIEASIDQRLAEAPILARYALGTFDAFTGVGFTASQALYLTAASLLQDPGSPPD